MTRDEYNTLFHKHQLNLVAFKMLFQCDEEVLRLVNAAIEAEREACAAIVEQFDEYSPRYGNHLTNCADAIRARGDDGQ